MNEDGYQSDDDSTPVSPSGLKFTVSDDNLPSAEERAQKHNENKQEFSKLVQEISEKQLNNLFTAVSVC